MGGFDENTPIGVNVMMKTRFPIFFNPLPGISEMAIPKSRRPPVPRRLERASQGLFPCTSFHSPLRIPLLIPFTSHLYNHNFCILLLP